MIETILIVLAAGSVVLLALKWMGVFAEAVEGSSTIPPGKIHIKNGVVHKGSTNDPDAENFNYAKDHSVNQTTQN